MSAPLNLHDTKGEPDVHIFDLRENSCRYPKERGTDGLRRFCGRSAVDPKKPYCTEHSKLMYTPLRGYAKPKDFKHSSLFTG